MPERMKSLNTLKAKAVMTVDTVHLARAETPPRELIRMKLQGYLRLNDLHTLFRPHSAPTRPLA